MKREGIFHKFIAFTLLSGIGWVLDFLTFTILTLNLNIPGDIANFISSYVGVTFVWFTSLKRVFGRTKSGRASLLIIYWLFQFFSILFYSKLLHEIAVFLVKFEYSTVSISTVLILSKIIVTPFNLLTNFTFMKWFTCFMRADAATGE